MINVGLKAYIWQNETTIEQRTAREVWSLNGHTYGAYKTLIERCKGQGSERERQHGRPDEREAVVQRVQLSSRSPYTFSGVASIFDQSKACVTVLQFSTSRPARLAWGSSDGSVSLCEGEDPYSLLQEAHDHNAAVTSLAWSPEGRRLLTTDAKGGVSVRDTGTFELVRTFLYTASAVVGCCFHQFNPNILVIGCECGELHTVNCSTGTQHESGRLKQHLQGGISSILNTGNLFLVADCRGSVHVLRSEVSGIMTRPLQKVASLALPLPRNSRAASMVYTGFSSLAQSPSLMLTYTNQLLCILRLDAQTGGLSLAAKAAPPTAARDIAARFCPLAALEGPEHIAMGGEDRGVHIYAVSDGLLRSVETVQGHLAPVTDVCWSPSGDILASGDCSGTVILWKRQKVQLSVP